MARVETMPLFGCWHYVDVDTAYPFGELDEIVLAYATTIHKSQGSEYPAVVIPSSRSTTPCCNATCSTPA